MPITPIEPPARAHLVECSIDITRPTRDVYHAFLHRIGEWFYESEESRLTRPTHLEPHVGGRFYIALPDGGANLIANVTMLKPNAEIRLRGDCTVPEPFIANMTAKFEPSDNDNATRLTILHRMAGAYPETLPAEFEAGWNDGLDKLKAILTHA